MKQNTDKIQPLFAIYKNDIHIGNVRGTTSVKAINNYILESGYLREELKNNELIHKYKAIIAVINVHF